MFENLQLEPVLSRPDLVPECITNMLKVWAGSSPVSEVLVTPIDPDLAGVVNFANTTKWIQLLERTAW